jgi:hypothetical protein
MSNADKTAETLYHAFLEADEKRRKDPVWGTRNGENALMALCEHIKKNGSQMDETLKDRIVRDLQKQNLVYYRSYCREHLLDIGITNV